MYTLGGINMIEATRLPEELVTRVGIVHSPFGSIGPIVEKRILEGIDEIQQLYVSPWTSIKMHGHDNQWEVWAQLSHKTAYVCLQDEEHELVNNTGSMMILMAIKGHINYSYDDLAGFLQSLGFTVTHGSMVVND